jgi:hypothetical protein
MTVSKIGGKVMAFPILFLIMGVASLIFAVILNSKFSELDYKLKDGRKIG